MLTDINIYSYENNIQKKILDSYFKDMVIKLEKAVQQRIEIYVWGGEEGSSKELNGNMETKG